MKSIDLNILKYHSLRPPTQTQAAAVSQETDSQDPVDLFIPSASSAYTPAYRPNTVSSADLSGRQIDANLRWNTRVLGNSAKLVGTGIGYKAARTLFKA